MCLSTAIKKDGGITLENESIFADPFHLLGMISAICDMPISSSDKVEIIRKAIKEFIEHYQSK